MRELSDAGAAVCTAPDVFDALRVTVTPFAVVLSAQNSVESRGTPNSLEQLEALVQLESFRAKGSDTNVDVIAHVATSNAPTTQGRLEDIGY